ncbi:uncharacterized protein LOC116429095 [Nomia melanderi]|uniref:uncharacterized protein LOC116429095 n=1 Tax=Nomia melanderi TaxID=2448451 RepID=UPI0013047B0F|nr:centrosomal protein of 78 kDa-like [Nomia melanderi]
MAVPIGENFANSYMELCKQQRLRPLPVICVTLPHSLDFTTDRVKMDDWGPILNSLSLDRSLRSICVRSRYQCRKSLEEINSEDKARTMGKAPVVLSRYLLEWMSHSVGQCIRNSPVLTNLELEGIPFPPDCLTVLCVGLSHTQTLRYLSFQRCYIGDTSCEVLCRTVADIPSIRSLNLSSCDLTSKCGPALAAALSRQKLSLYHDTWKQSLRYQEPNLEAMPGLRRLTLNDNPQLGDVAASELIEAIRDSLWLKALDMQRCGLTDRLVKDLFELLNHNTTLIVLDVRQNANLNEDLVKHIMKRLEKNNADTKSEYRWLGSSEQNRRVSSAGSRKRIVNENKALARPRSAMTEYAKRPYQVPPRNVNSLMNNAKKTKLRPHVPSYKNPSVQRRQQDPQQIVQCVQTKQKVSLHLDLQSHIQSVMGEASGNTVSNQTYGGNVQQVTDRTSSNHMSTGQNTKVDAATQMADGLDLENSDRIKLVQVQLAEAKAEHERLLEETRHSDLLLAEERNRREEAETKLNAMKKDFIQLENALKDKEKETSGLLLIRQQSMEEISSCFERLLKILDSVTNNPSRKDTAVATFVKDDIKRCISSVIRHTKSENLRRAFAVNVDEDESIGYTEPMKKFAKSESDMRSTLPPMYLERNIGDSPDIGSPSLDARILRHERELMSPRKRARALFAQIVHGDAVVEFSTNED